MSDDHDREEKIKHYHAIRIEHLKAAFIFVEKGAWALFFLNGGGVLAVLSFIAALWSKGETASFPTVAITKALLGLPIWIFCIGLIFTAALYVCSYFAQLQYFNDNYQGAKIPHFIGYFCAAVSIISFVVAVTVSGSRISNILP